LFSAEKKSVRNRGKIVNKLVEIFGVLPLPKFVIKRDGSKALFDEQKIATAIWKSVMAVGGTDKERSDAIAKEVVEKISAKYGSDGLPSVEEVQYLV
jgi:hypothetical protein